MTAVITHTYLFAIALAVGVAFGAVWALAVLVPAFLLYLVI